MFKSTIRLNLAVCRVAIERFYAPRSGPGCVLLRDFAFAVFLALALPALAAPPAVTLREVASGLVAPLEIAHAGDGSGRLFIVEQVGRVKIVKNGTVLAAPFLDVSALITATGSEQGLLGLAFHPQYLSNRKFYIFYTRAADGALVVSEFLASAAAPDLADVASERVLIVIPHPVFSNHNGGRLAFGPDGYLYIGTGDGGGAGDPNNNAQNLSSLLGKLLRIDVNTSSGYLVPPTNPFVGQAGAAPEIWAWGLRNPWRFSFDRATGDLFIGDVGQGAWEEIDFEPAGAAGGLNYGWNVFEGTHCFNPPAGCSLNGHVPPVLEYAHDAQGGHSVTGGYRYRGKKSQPLRGFYLYGDFVSSRVWAAKFEAGVWSTAVLIEPPSVLSGISSFGEDEAGELYVASYNTGRIYAIDGPGPSADVRADFNNDSRSDIVWADRKTADSTIWLMNGATVTSSTLFPYTGWGIARVGDFDGDGKADILWSGSSDRYAISFMNGTTAASVAPIPSPPDQTLYPTVVADFDGDGKADILWRGSLSGENVLWLMNGADIKSGARLPTVPSNQGIYIGGVADFDGDGKADILWSKAFENYHVIWLMNGATVVSATVLPLAPPGSIASVGDFDGDGKADILWRNTASGENTIWLMNGTAIKSSTSIRSAPGNTGLVLAGVGDFNGDGYADILWRQSGDGFNAIWFMNGTTVASEAAIPSMLPSWYVLEPD